MTAAEARNKVIMPRDKSRIHEIYKEINEAINAKFHNTYILFNISKEDKKILEKDGYYVDTAYHSGFQVRWYEAKKDYIENLVSNQKHCYLKTDPIVIDNYIKLQGF